MDLAGRLDKVLEMSACEEVSKVNKFTMVLILDVDNAPLVLSAPDLLAIDDDRLLTANDSEGDDVLDGGGQQMAIMGKTRSKWRAIVECILRSPFR